MAKSKGPLFSFRASGRFAKTVIYQKTAAGNIVKKFASPRNPKTILQVAVRSAMQGLIGEWRGLSAAQKQSWAYYLPWKNLPGYSLFLQYNFTSYKATGDFSAWAPGAAEPPAPDFPVDGLVSYWKLDEAVDASTFADSVGDKTGWNYGAVSGEAGKINNAVFFDIEDFESHILLPGDIVSSAGSGLSVSAWFKGSGGGASRSIFSIGSEVAFTVRVNNNKAEVFAADDEEHYVVTSLTTLAVDTWYHVVGTWSKNGALIVFINSVSEGLLDVPDTFLEGAYVDNYIGLAGAGMGGTFDGLIDEVGVWSRELTDLEVSALYNSGAGLPLPD